MQQIPIVDLSDFGRGDRERDADVGQELCTVCESIGFAVLTGHGISPATGEHLHRAGHRFFGLALEEKLRVRRPRNDQNRGYIPYGEETLVRMAGGDSPPDYKEVFAIGPDVLGTTEYFTGPRSYPSFAPNRWPERPTELRPAMLDYWHAMEGLMRTVAQALALGLGLERNAFDDVLDDTHTSQLRLLHYPPLTTPPAPGQLRAGAHTDVGMMTILRNDDAAGGLQIRGRQDQWLDAPALHDSYILNIGDLLARWSNDRLVSTAHRVVIPPADAQQNTDRLSIGFFVGPRYDAMVSCLPTCESATHPAKYPPVSVHDYRTARFAAGAGDNQPFQAD